MLTKSDMHTAIVFTAVYPATLRSYPEKDSEEKYDIGVGCKWTNI